MFQAVTVPLLIIRGSVIIEYELSVEKLLLYPPIRLTDTFLLKLSFFTYVAPA